MKLLLAILLFSVSLASHAVVTFQLTPVSLGNGYTLKGTLATDGTAGSLSPGNILDWNITITQTTDTVFTEKNTVVNAQGVSCDGRRILVQPSEDPTNYIDGGSLTFSGPAARGSIPATAVVADFTSFHSWLFPDSLTAGVGGWYSELGINLFSPLVPATAAVGSPYLAATLVKPNVFRIKPVTVQTTPTLMTLSGTITTDGTVGPLSVSPTNNFLAWRLVAREQDIQTYTPGNSNVLNIAGVSSDNTTLKVSNPGGVLEIGTPNGRYMPGISVTLADFSVPANPQFNLSNVALYSYYGSLLASKSPLTRSSTYTVATR